MHSHRSGGDGAGQVDIVVNDQTVSVPSGVTVVSALASLGRRVLRPNLVTEEGRGAFCGMGVCWECAITIDGVRDVRACLTVVAQGMHVTIEGEC